jgi:hypothetical protein
MLPEVKRDILSTLSETIQSISAGNISHLSDLSNHTIHNASIFQDEDSISVAVVVYALAKIFQREQKVDKAIVEQLKRASSALFENNFGAYKQAVKDINTRIAGLDSKLKLYIKEVITQAQIRKGSKIYDHGISLARASEMLGVSQWELMAYVGKTQIIEGSEKAKRAASRLAFTRRLFSL